MPGALDPTYIAARRVLLDALSALGDHRQALVLVGAQAVYVHAGDAGLVTAPFTADGDLAIDVAAIADHPHLAEAMGGGDFAPSDQPGRWIGQDSIPVDLLVPEALGGSGRRGAQLGPHGNRAARKVKGLEAALVDRAPHTIGALEESDRRVFKLNVAGPAALVIAKLCKIDERLKQEARSPGKQRATDKDALDVLRLLRTADVDDLATTLGCLSTDALASVVTVESLGHLPGLFGSPEAPGARMAARAASFMEDPATVAASCAALAQELMAALAARQES